VFDQAGNLYGTTSGGGGGNCDSGYGCGVVYELAASNGKWTEKVLYPFGGGADGAAPNLAAVIFDKAGNLYGTTYLGGDLGACYGYGCGVVFQLTPSGSDWTEQVLYTFTGGNDGQKPVGGLIFDGSGNLYGSTSTSGTGDGGTVFELTPSNDNWVPSFLYSFQGGGPYASLSMRAAGNLYGTDDGGGAYGDGSIFKLTPNADGTWTYTSLHDFAGGSDGDGPISNVIFDAKGNLYGTAMSGGDLHCGGGFGCGVIWEITP
jgi:uncharacterized repeat protein (TIGR03803 family)